MKLVYGTIIVLVLIAGGCISYLTSPDPGSADENFTVKVVDTLCDILNPLRTAEPLNEFVKEYDFELSLGDLEYFAEAGKIATEAGYRTEFASHWRNVKLLFEGEKYDAEMSLRGDLPNHYSQPKKSYKIKADKEEFINNIREYNLIIAEDRLFFSPLYAEWLAKKIGLVTANYEMGLIRINGVPQGLYTVEEAWDSYLMEKNKQPGTSIIFYSDNWKEDNAKNQPRKNLANAPFNLELSSIKQIESPFEREINGRINEMFKVVKSDDKELFDVYFDVEQIARFEAWRAILGQDHDFGRNNLKLFYNTTTGKFGIVPRNEGGINDQNTVGMHDQDLGKEGYDPCTKTGTGILYYVSRNPEVVERKKEILKEVLKDGEELVNYYKELEDKYLGIALLDNTTIRRSSKVAYYSRRNKAYLEKNVEFLKQCT